MARHRATAAWRFWSKVRFDGPLSLRDSAPGHCWIWTGADRDPKGPTGHHGERYGAFRDDNRLHYAHRFAYELEHGPITPITLADGTTTRAVADHRCEQRNCVRPDHIEIVDDHTNILRGTAPSAINARKTTCHAGHDLTDPANVFVDFPRSHPRGRRRCRACCGKSAHTNTERQAA